MKASAVSNEVHITTLNVYAGRAAGGGSPWSDTVRGSRMYISGSASPSTLGFFNDNGTWTPRFFPRYSDSLQEGGFNANDMFSPMYTELC
jgi:hypothetical protein